MVLDTVYLCMCQSGDAPDGIQMQNMGITKNGNPASTENAAELEQLDR